MNILDTIIARKKTEVASRKQQTSVAELEKSKFFTNETLSLKKFLLDENKTGIIAEFKRKSPSKGIINNKATLLLPSVCVRIWVTRCNHRRRRWSTCNAFSV